MDEKFMELRKRFEQSKSLFSSHLAKALKESSELRVKYTMICGGTGGTLDSIDPTTYSKHNNRAKSASSKSNNHHPNRHAAYDLDKSNTMKSQDNYMYLQQQSPNIVKYAEQFINTISSKSNQQLHFLQQPTDKESETPYNNTYTPKSNKSNQGFSQQRHNPNISQSNMNNTQTNMKVPDESYILKKIASKTKKKNWSREELEDLMNK